MTGGISKIIPLAVRNMGRNRSPSPLAISAAISTGMANMPPPMSSTFTGGKWHMSTAQRFPA